MSDDDLIRQFRKKPVVIEAVQWTGDNLNAVMTFCAGDATYELMAKGNAELVIGTLEDGAEFEARHVASRGDWIIKGVKGEFYPCKPDIFDATYEDATYEDAALPAVTGPRPKDGWNVMQFGQVGWHVVQSADGWTVSRLFGPEILSRDDEGFSPFGPNHVANSDGGRSAAEAPADPQIATLQAEQAGLVEVLQGLMSTVDTWAETCPGSDDEVAATGPISEAAEKARALLAELGETK